MSAIIRRKKKLYEDGAAPVAQSSAPVATAAPTSAPVQPAPAQPAPAPAQQNGTATQPSNQALTQTTTNQQTDLSQQLTNQPENNQPTELQLKVASCINNIAEIVKKNDPYALMALDVPTLIKQSIPEFKSDEPNAKSVVSAWQEFLKNANKDSFAKVTNALTTFGNGGKQEEAPAQPTPQLQPAQLTQPQLPAQTDNVQNVSNSLVTTMSNHMQGESLNKKFSQELKESLESALRRDKMIKMLQENYNNSEY